MPPPSYGSSDEEDCSPFLNSGCCFDEPGDGKIIIEKGLLFRTKEHFKRVFKDYMIQQGFKIRRTHNKHRLFAAKCKILGCPWKTTDSPPTSGISFQIKSLTNIHHYNKLH